MKPESLNAKLMVKWHEKKYSEALEVMSKWIHYKIQGLGVHSYAQDYNDLYHDVCVSILTALPQYSEKEGSLLLGYLSVVVKNRVYNHFRLTIRQREMALQFTDGFDATDPTDPFSTKPTENDLATVLRFTLDNPDRVFGQMTRRRAQYRATTQVLYDMITSGTFTFKNWPELAEKVGVDYRFLRRTLWYIRKYQEKSPIC